jgi:hypothetical protein
MRRVPGTAAIVSALLVVSGPAAAPEPGWRTAELYSVFYGHAVCDYCGLITEQVDAGFRLARDRLIEAGALTQEEVRQLRASAWLAADHEWANRGLGGYRLWCRTEGAAAAERFLHVAAQPRQAAH